MGEYMPYKRIRMKSRMSEESKKHMRDLMAKGVSFNVVKGEGNQHKFEVRHDKPEEIEFKLDTPIGGGEVQPVEPGSDKGDISARGAASSSGGV
jgi:hypothetical protein